MSAIYHMAFTRISQKTVCLKSVCDIVKGKQLNGEFLSECGSYYVMNGGIEPSGYYEEFNTEADTISISEGGNSCGYVKYNEVPFWSGGHCYTLENLSNAVNRVFLYHLLKYREADIMKLRIGSGLPNIQKKDLDKFLISLPPKEEQVSMAKMFNAIESKIKIEESIRSLIEKRKSYLLQQMFI